MVSVEERQVWLLFLSGLSETRNAAPMTRDLTLYLTSSSF